MLGIENVHKHYGGLHVLNDVSFELDTGTVLAIVGDNGAGKSTLVKCISGTTNPDAGNINFQDQSLNKATPHMTRSAGIEMIYQDLGLCGQQDVLTNVFLGR